MVNRTSGRLCRARFVMTVYQEQSSGSSSSISVGSDSEAGPATLVAAGGPEGPDDRAEETQTENGSVINQL